MVRISTGPAHDLYRIVYCESLIPGEQPDELRYHHGRMRVVDLYGYMLVHLIEIVACLLHLLDDELCSVGHHEVLLIDTQEVAGLVRIIRIQEEREVLLYILLVEVYTALYKRLVQTLQVEEVQLVHTVLVSHHIYIIEDRLYLLASSELYGK